MKTIHSTSLAVILLLAGCKMALSQAAQTSVCDPKVYIQYYFDPAQIRDDIQNDPSSLKVDMGLGTNEAPCWLQQRLLHDQSSRAVANALSQVAESASQSLQNGSNPASAASTSLATKSMSSLLGIAEETGAVSSTTSGTSTTLTVNVQQLANYLGLSGHPCYLVSTDCTVGNWLSRGASVAVSLNPATQTNGLSSIATSALSGLTGVQNPVFSSLSFQETLHGRRKMDVSQKAFKDALTKIDPTLRSSPAVSLKELASTLTKNNPAYDNALGDCVAALQATGGNLDKIKPVEDTCADNIYNSVKNRTNLQTKLLAYINADEKYATVRDAALSALFYPTTFSLEYDLTNNAKQPLVSTFKAIYGYSPNSSGSDKTSKGQLQITGNGSVTMYNSLESGSESRLRSAQAAAQFDYKPNSTQKLQTEWSAGYYFQYMVANGLIDLPSTALAPGTSSALPSGASTLLNTTGPDPYRTRQADAFHQRN